MRIKEHVIYTKQKLERTPYFTKDGYNYSEEQLEFLNAYMDNQLNPQSSYSEGIINDYADEAQRVLLDVKTKYLLVDENSDVLAPFVMASNYDEARKLVKEKGIAFHDVVEESVHLSNELVHIKQEKDATIMRALGDNPVRSNFNLLVRQRNLTLPMMVMIDTLNEQKEIMDEEEFIDFLEGSIKLASDVLARGHHEETKYV